MRQEVANSESKNARITMQFSWDCIRDLGNNECNIIFSCKRIAKCNTTEYNSKLYLTVTTIDRSFFFFFYPWGTKKKLRRRSLTNNARYFQHFVAMANLLQLEIACREQSRNIYVLSHNVLSRNELEVRQSRKT